MDRRAQGARAAFGGAFVPVRECVGSRFVPGGQSAWEPQRATGVLASVFIEPAPGFGYSPGRAPRELPCCFENWLSKYSPRSWQQDYRPADCAASESGCGWGHPSARGGGVGRGHLAIGSTSSPSLPLLAAGEPAMGEVRGQFLAGDRFGFRHTFPEECGGFVPGAGPSPSPSPSPEPRSPEAGGRGAGASVPLLIFYGHSGELSGRQVNY